MRSSALPDNAGVEPIALIGVGCRFPGADGPEAFWTLLRDGVDAIREIPLDRPDLAARYDPGPGTPGRLTGRWGGFLEGLDRFDASFFGISPREAERMDPQQRLLLEVAWEALEDAGQVAGRPGSIATGVFVGLWINDYQDLLFAESRGADFYMTTGSGRYSASGRVSYAFGFQGPSITVDTACSSSLVAVHLACQALRARECTLALAGGANTILSPHVSVAYSQSKMLSPDGRCKFGDARGDGYVRSEGVGIVALKLLSRALADGDPIQAVILGSAVNNDGKTGGFLGTPGREGQEDVLRKAYRAAGVDPGQVQYVEAHGTGTSAGDPVELQALGHVLAGDRPPGRPCRIGSVKTNIGHTEGAAGVAGLIKAALSLRHRTIPASLHFREPNPAVPWKDLPVSIAREASPWPAEAGPALAGVSAFGIAGTNAHVVLQEAPPAPESTAERADEGARLLPLSARSPEALRQMAAAWRDHLRSDAPAFPDVCYTASVRRAHHDHRLAVVAGSAAEAADHLDAFLHDEPRPGTSVSRTATSGSPRVAFVFPGQGSQWLGMGRGLLPRDTVFRSALEASDRAVREESGFSVLDELAADPARSRLDQIDVIQPTLFAIQVALAARWRSWGIEPAAVVGHSMGEVAAAHVAGVLSLEDAARVICRRSRLLRRTRGQGAMALVELSFAQAQAAIAGYEDRLSVAVSNSSRSTVLSGDPAALDELIAALEARDVFCRRVKVDVASHSPQMDALRGDLLHALAGLRPGPGRIPLYSTVTGQVAEGVPMDAAYWVRNLREPVMFSTVLGRLVAEGHSAFVEVSPHPILLPAVQQELQHLGREGVVLPSLRREEPEQATLLESLGALHVLGCEVDWQECYPTGGRCVRLPPYPWQRERFWYDTSRQAGKRRVCGAGEHPLLGPHLSSSTDAGMHYWETELSADLVPWLDEHRVDGLRVLPSSAYVEMALAAAAEAFGGQAPMLSSVTFERALVLSDDAAATVQVVVSSDSPSTATFRVSGREASGEARTGAWTLHAKGAIRLGVATEQRDAAPRAASEPSAEATVPASAHYQAMAARGLSYGPSFQGVERVWRREGETHGRLLVTAGMQADAAAYRIHPALLEAAFQLLVAAAAGTDAGAAGDETLVPVGLDHLQLQTAVDPTRPLWGRASLRAGSGTAGNEVVGDVVIRDDEGRRVLEARGVRLQQRGEGRQRQLDDCFFGIEWEAARRDGTALPPASHGQWLVFAGATPVGARLASALADRGDRVVTVFAGEDYARLDTGRYRIDPARPEHFRRLLTEARDTGGGSWRGIVHLWSLDAPDPSEGGLAALQEAQRLGCVSVLHLVQALAGGEPASSPRMWLVTAGTQPVERLDDALCPAQSPLWGLGRVVASEHSALRCSAIDLSPRPSDADLRSLQDELWQNGAEDQIALRGDARYVARLRRRLPKETAPHVPEAAPRLEPAIEIDAAVAVVPDGTYLITGAQDGLGLQVAVWLAGRGARHIALLGRSGLTVAAKEGIDGLTRAGVQVRLIRADVADEAELARALAEVDGAMPPLRGVIHAAAILDDAPLLEMDRPRLDAGMAPNVAGGWNLHVQTAGRALDFFVLFSSAAGLLGAPGHAGRAAGDAFLGALAAHRRARGMPALSVAWGSWIAGDAAVPEVAAKRLDECAYVVDWPRKERDTRKAPASEGPASWLILADRSGVGVALARLLRERGDTCTMLFAEDVRSTEMLGRVLREEWKSDGVLRRGVVHLWSLDAPPTDELSPASLDAAQHRGCVSALHLIRMLAAAGGPRLWLVTRGAQPAGPSPSSVAVAQAPLWGLGRVLALEQPECWGGLVDLDPGEDADAAPRLMEELTQADGEDQVAFRRGERRVARLVRAPLENEAGAGLSEGTYLVTGGVGGLGLQVARWLVERGARHLVLTSRTGLPARSRWDELAGTARERVEAIRALEALGVSVTVAAADASDAAAMARVFETFGRALPPLRGVVHAAGVLTLAPLAELEVPALLDVLRPKVAGAWILHELTRQLELDFFVLFSSAAAIWGSKALGHYAAANGFLDALAHDRRAHGLPALSVNWGWWSGGGMTSAETEAFFRRIGLGEMSAAQSLETLGRLLADRTVQKTVAEVDWDAFKSIYEAWGPRPLLQEVETAARETHVARAVLGSLPAAQGLQAWERILRERPLQVAVMPFDLGQWCASYPAATSSPLLARLRLENGAGAAVGAAAPPSVAEALLAIEPGRRRRVLLESHLTQRVAQVLRLAPARVDVNKPLKSLGLDSLMALELRNRLEADLGLKLSATLVWNHPTVTALVPHLADRMGIPLEGPTAEVVPALTAGDEEGIVRMLNEIELLTADEARRALADGMARG